MTTPDDFKLSADPLTLGDYALIETALRVDDPYTGETRYFTLEQSVLPASDPAYVPGARFVTSAVMIWVRRRKLDPSYTLAEALALGDDEIERFTAQIVPDEAVPLPDPRAPGSV